MQRNKRGGGGEGRGRTGPARWDRQCGAEPQGRQPLDSTGVSWGSLYLPRLRASKQTRLLSFTTTRPRALMGGLGGGGEVSLRRWWRFPPPCPPGEGKEVGSPAWEAKASAFLWRSEGPCPHQKTQRRFCSSQNLACQLNQRPARGHYSIQKIFSPKKKLSPLLTFKTPQ